MLAKTYKLSCGRIKSRERGFTLIELLIVVAILAILASVIIPNVSTFIGSGNLAAAQTELQNVKTASLGYRADNGVWPANSGLLLAHLNGSPKATYAFDTATGFVIGVSNVSWSGISWSAPSQPYSQDGRWVK